MCWCVEVLSAEADFKSAKGGFSVQITLLFRKLKDLEKKIITISTF
jgi:hypothetical protein